MWLELGYSNMCQDHSLLLNTHTREKKNVMAGIRYPMSSSLNQTPRLYMRKKRTYHGYCQFGRRGLLRRPSLVAAEVRDLRWSGGLMYVWDLSNLDTSTHRAPTGHGPRA